MKLYVPLSQQDVAAARSGGLGGLRHRTLQASDQTMSTLPDARDIPELVLEAENADAFESWPTDVSYENGRRWFTIPLREAARMRITS